MAYDEAYAIQVAHHAEVLAAREAGVPEIGRVLLVEHDPPVITISKRPDAAKHLLATPELLARHGVTLAETDRGGDITYHGPGQLVVYPIVDLNRLRLGLHDYMRLLEQVVIDTCETFKITAERDRSATGVWVQPPDPAAPAAKIAAMGVRVRKWVTLHGLALNVTTNLDHFGLIVPCGLVGRPVTSLRREIGLNCPTMPEVKEILTGHLHRRVVEALDRATAARAENGLGAVES